MTPDNRPSLVQRMRALHESSPPPGQPQLLAAAQAFEDASTAFYANPQTVTMAEFAVTWVAARRCYCEALGEPLP